ncbi:hypothetical protein AMD00_10760 [Viridibacillus arvi]|uniref:Uncharacterized protein n=1 Tax=Viridibacillus arvi TaxID=263475 RepID=A0A0M0LCS3_9BACL|nr:hypothetical protein AMD00_10760 [Viridibacillus arvi]
MGELAYILRPRRSVSDEEPQGPSPGKRPPERKLTASKKKPWQKRLIVSAMAKILLGTFQCPL